MCTDRRARGPLPLTSGTCVCLREIRRDDRHGVCDLFCVPVLPLDGCPAGGACRPVPAGGLSEDLVDEQGDGIIAAGRALAAVQAAGIRSDVAADEGQHGGERDQVRVEAGLAGSAGGEGSSHVVTSSSARVRAGLGRAIAPLMELPFDRVFVFPGIRS
jgi:hypothetical protein